MLFANKRSYKPSIFVDIGWHSIDKIKQTKFLGIYLDNKSNWKNMYLVKCSVVYVIAKAGKVLKIIKNELYELLLFLNTSITLAHWSENLVSCKLEKLTNIYLGNSCIDGMIAKCHSYFRIYFSMLETYIYMVPDNLIKYTLQK